MKKSLFLVLILGFFVSCKKEKTETAINPPPDHIIAGQQTGPGIDFQHIDLSLKFKHRHVDTLQGVDLDKDGISDFFVHYLISISPGSSYAHYKIIPAPHAYIAVDTDEPHLALALQVGDRIDAGLAWTNDTTTMYLKSGGFAPQLEEGLWTLNDEKHLGVKLMLNNFEVFAWVKVITVSSFYHFEIHSSGIAKGN